MTLAIYTLDQENYAVYDEYTEGKTVYIYKLNIGFMIGWPYTPVINGLQEYIGEYESFDQYAKINGYKLSNDEYAYLYYKDIK